MEKQSVTLLLWQEGVKKLSHTHHSYITSSGFTGKKKWRSNRVILSHKETLFSGLTQAINFTGILVVLSYYQKHLWSVILRYLLTLRPSHVPNKHNPGIFSSSEPHYADQYRIRKTFKLMEKSIREEFNGLL